MVWHSSNTSAIERMIVVCAIWENLWIYGATVLVGVDSLTAFAFESLSTNRRETNVVDKIALRSLGVL